jgi:phosphoribosyl 1,2-cyclic phosphate phosphodiesterase
MLLRVLGSAAAEGWPAPFCVCEACQEARRRGGKDLRRRTSYQLGDQVHVDWGPDSYHSMIALSLDYSPLRHLLITHSHQDHWCPQELYWRRQGFSQVPEGSWLTIHGNTHVEQILGAGYEDLDRLFVDFHLVEPFAELPLVGTAVTAVGFPASHASDDELALNYLLTVGGRTALIGNDTGWWEEEVWDFLEGYQVHVVLLDSTSGPKDRNAQGQLMSWVGTHHFSCRGVVAVRDELAKRGVLASDCRFVANHFSHNGGWLHEDLEAFFGPEGIEVGYDGMGIEV